jgi:hypothetical protein
MVALDLGDVRSLETLWAPLDLKLDFVTFVQRAVAFADDRLVVNEHVFARLTLDESVTLGTVEPLYYSLFHRESPRKMELTGVRQRPPLRAPVVLLLNSQQSGERVSDLNYHRCSLAIAERFEEQLPTATEPLSAKLGVQNCPGKIYESILNCKSAPLKQRRRPIGRLVRGTGTSTPTRGGSGIRNLLENEKNLPPSKIRNRKPTLDFHLLEKNGLKEVFFLFRQPPECVPDSHG